MYSNSGAGGGYGGGQQRAISKNLSNEEYLERQSEINRLKKMQEQQSRERQEQKKVQEREAGFNVYLSGANQKRVDDQRQREKYGMVFQGGGSGSGSSGAAARQSSQNRSGSRSRRKDSQGARRRWLAPNQNEEENESMELSAAKKSNYQNPFMINESQNSGANVSPFAGPNIPRPSNQPSGKRKQWGGNNELPKQQNVIGANFLDSNTPETVARKDRQFIKPLSLSDSEDEKEEMKTAKPSSIMVQDQYNMPADDDEDEDNYSDSFEEINNTVETVPKQEIEDLLKTATEDQLNILKESLGNWADVKRMHGDFGPSSAAKLSAQKDSRNTEQLAPAASKNLNQTIDDEDYIEEDFEEDNSDSPIEDATGYDNEEEERLEQERLEQMQKRNRIQSTRAPAKGSRPISATYNLANLQSKPSHTHTQSNTNLKPASGYLAQVPSTKKSDTFQAKQDMLNALDEENRKAIQGRRPAASATNYKGPGVITSLGQKESQHHASSNLESIAESQRSDKTAVNPFGKGRPISQMLPKRPEQYHQKSKTMHQAKLPKATDHQNFMLSSENQNQQHQRHMSGNNAYQQIPPRGNNNTIEEHEMEGDTTFSRHDLDRSDFKSSSIVHTGADDQKPKGPVSIAELLAQIQRLEDSQRHQLFLVLKDMETTGGMSATNLQRGLEQFLVPKADAPTVQQPAQPSTQQKPVSKKQQQAKVQSQPVRERIHNELVLRVLSTLGNPHVCGLTEVELFDSNAEKIPLVASCIMVRNQGKGPKVSVEKLVNGKKLIKDDKQMWLGYLPTPPNRLEIMFRYDKGIQVGGIKIWNYNKGIIHSSTGVNEFQILVNDEIKWTGQLAPGKGQIATDYAKAIILKENPEPGFALPKEDIPETATPSQTSSTNAGSISSSKLQPVQQLSSAHSMQQLSSMEENKLSDEQTQEERLKQYRSRLELAKGINNQSAAAGPIWLDQEPKPKPREKKRFSEYRDQQLPNSKASAAAEGVSRQRADSLGGEISSIVQGAVDSVNKAVQMSNSKRKANVEESLDSLDFFKVTNLGRFGQNKEQASSTKQQSRIQTIADRREQANPSIQSKQQRPKWNSGQSQQQPSIDATGSQSSAQRDLNNSSGRKLDGGPVIKSGSLPEEFMMPSPARSIPSRKTRKERDVLDDFIGLEIDDPSIVVPSSINQPKPQAAQTKAVEQQERTTSAFEQQVNLAPVQQQNYETLLETTEVKVSSRIHPEMDDSYSTDETSTVMPTLPQGKKLEINILETWGDMNYLGLTGIEVFDELGMPVEIFENQILAFPPDVNVLPGYGNDPRTIDKLVDGQYFTNDDLHVWLTPFTSGEDHQISINLGKFTGVSMIRIWNYNKSRIHSYRGAKKVQIELDGQPIFRGEIRKAPGNTKNPEDCCEILLFTEDDAVLETIDSHDWLNDLDIDAEDFDNTQRITEFQIQEGQTEERPMTATKKFSTAEVEELQFQLQQQQSKPTSLFDERPMTSAIVQSQRIGMPPPQQQRPYQSTLAAVEEEDNYTSQRSLQPLVKKPAQGVRGQVLFLNITQSWGDLFYVGLNGLEVLDEQGNLIPITVERGLNPETGQRSKISVQAEPRDMNSIPGHASDHRTLEKLFNGENNTTDDRNMWLIPFNTGEDHTIRIDLGEVRTVSAVKFYNYNKSVEDTLRGSRQVIIRLDDSLMTPKKGITLRVAPGTMNGIEDIAQTVKLPYLLGWANDQIIPVQRSLDTQTNQVPYFQEYEPIAMPMGFMFKLNLYSTHGDLFYIGLNGIEIYDQNGFDVCRTRRDDFRIFAYPAGVHSLQGMRDDIRVVGNLVDGQSQTAGDNHIWLTPYKNTKGHANAQATEKDMAKKREPNYIVLLFDQPVALGALRLWNYSKTPARGVNEFELEVDGHKIYRGFVRKAPENIAGGQANDWSTVVLFDGEARNADSLGRQICFNPGKVQNVLLMNEKRQMNAQHQKAHVNEKFVFDEQLRPQTKAFFK